MKEYTTQNPKWLQWIAPEEFNNAELFRIVMIIMNVHLSSKMLADVIKRAYQYLHA